MGLIFGHIQTAGIGFTWPWKIGFYLRSIQNILSDRFLFGLLVSNSLLLSLAILK